MGGIIMEEMWIARDKSEILFLYVSNYEPIKEDECWTCCGGDCIALDGSLFPEVKWSDKEPTKVKFIIEK